MEQLPRLLLGTSPFIAAGQFGERSLEYYAKFVGRPEAVEEVARASLEVGVRGVQLLPYPWVCEGVRRAIRATGADVAIVGTLLPDDLEASVRALSELGAAAALVHGAVSDVRDAEVLSRHLRLCEMAAPLVGLATHQPIRTLSWLREQGISVDLVMAPINKVGFLLDGPVESAVRLYRSLGVPVIGKKVLAAGRLRPREALEFVKATGAVSSVALGVSSVEEARETFGVALEVLGP